MTPQSGSVEDDNDNDNGEGGLRLERKKATDTLQEKQLSTSGEDSIHWRNPLPGKRTTSKNVRMLAKSGSARHRTRRFRLEASALQRSFYSVAGGSCQRRAQFGPDKWGRWPTAIAGECRPEKRCAITSGSRKQRHCSARTAPERISFRGAARHSLASDCCGDIGEFVAERGVS